MNRTSGRAGELALLGILALLWGSSYLFLKTAVIEIPPVTIIALRVLGATLFLGAIMAFKGESVPNDTNTWGRLLIQAILNSIAAWTLLAWGQQYVDAGLASVLNSTAPIFVVIATALLPQQQTPTYRKITGAGVGLVGVAAIVGTDALSGLGDGLSGQIACLVGAALYAGAALHGRRFGHISPLATATGTMIWASIALVPAALLFEQPWTLKPSIEAMLSVAILSIPCTAIALLIYFRLVRTLGSLGTASQAYLRAGIGVLLGVSILGETLTLNIALGMLLAIGGVALINWPARR